MKPKDFTPDDKLIEAWLHAWFSGEGFNLIGDTLGLGRGYVHNRGIFLRNMGVPLPHLPLVPVTRAHSPPKPTAAQIEQWTATVTEYVASNDPEEYKREEVIHLNEIIKEALNG